MKVLMNGGSSAGADLLYWIRIAPCRESVPEGSWRSIVGKIRPGPLWSGVCYYHARAYSCQLTPWPAVDSKVGIAFRAHTASASVSPQMFLFKTSAPLLVYVLAMS